MPSDISSSHDATVVECVFYPTHDTHRGLPWLGPDPLAHDTHGEDLFSYMATFLIQDRVDWIELRLRMSSYLAAGFSDEYVFFLPRKESLMGNLPRIRELIHGLISKAPPCLETKSQLQLAIYSHTDDFSSSLTQLGSSCLTESDDKSLLDPEWFVLNIAANFH